MYKLLLIVILFIIGRHSARQNDVVRNLSKENTPLQDRTPLKVLEEKDVIVGAAQFELYLPKLKDKKVAIVTNVSGMVGKTSIVDTLLKLKVKIKKVFGPEHGFRGIADAGEKVRSNFDKKTGLPVISLYGSHKKPTA